MNWWRAGVVAVAGLAAVAPLPPPLVERWYSGWVFPLIQAPVTGAVNRVPFAVFDLVLAGSVAILVLVVARMAVTWSRLRWRAVARAAMAVALMAAVLFLWFWLIWGLNYRRPPIEDRLARSPAAKQEDAVLELAARAVAELNGLHATAHAAGFGTALERDARFRSAFSETLRALGHVTAVEPGRLKPTIIGPFFRWAGVDGMISPFTLEVLANPDLLPFERPFVTAHEWGHLAGFGDEAEASFVGWLTCMHAEPAGRYSGWLFLLWQARAEVVPTARARLDTTLGPGPRADMAAVVARLQRGTKPRIRRVSWAAYDQYLKANRVDEGVRSYSRVLELLARTQFDAEWNPRLTTH